MSIGRVLLLVAVVPIITFAAGWLAINKLDAGWREALEAQYGPISDADFAKVRLQVICRDPETPPDFPCTEATLADVTEIGSPISLVAGLGLIGLITVAGRAAANDRRRLVALFRPLLYVTIVVVSGLVLLDGALVSAAAYLLPVAFVERIPIGIIFAVGLAVLFASVRIVRYLLRLREKAVNRVLGEFVQESDAPGLFRLVREVAADVGTEPPAHVVLGLDPTFFVTEVDVQTPRGERSAGRTLFASLPLLRLLSTDEVRAVLGHELAHFQGEDTVYSRRFYPIYRAVSEQLQLLVTSAGSGAGALALLPATTITAFFLGAFATAESGLSREREMAADEVGARLAGADQMGRALVKVHAYADRWPVVLGRLQQGVWDPSVANLSLALERSGREMSPQELSRGVQYGTMAHPTDSHPELGERLTHLGLDQATVERAILGPAGGRSASDLVSQPEPIEGRLSLLVLSLVDPVKAASLKAGGVAPDRSAEITPPPDAATSEAQPDNPR